jgi:hypothetical protein
MLSGDILGWGQPLHVQTYTHMIATMSSVVSIRTQAIEAALPR